MKRADAVPLLLAVSLALNLAFMSFHVLQRLRRSRPTPPPEFRSDFGLRAGQDARVREIVRSFKLASIQFKEDILDKRVAIIEELGGAAPDPERIAARTEELNALEAQLNRDFIAALLRVADELDPRQRLDMITRLSRGWFFLDRGAKQGGPHE